MKKDRLNLPTALLLPNLGQLEWLPKNPRQWTQDDIDRTAKSIREDEDFLEDRPLLVTPQGKKWIIFAGNLRRTAAAQAGVKTLPCVVYLPETDEDYDTIKRRAMKDNGSFGSWDYDTLANDWGDLPLTDWGVPVWDADKDADWEKNGLSSKGREGVEGYDEFVDKFKQKVTTDDCYTPPEVYDIVRDFVDKQVAPLDGRIVVRPFYPGGDFENYEYPKGCVVLDNPPFSIYSKVVRFYLERGIDFFLFGPNLTLFVANADCTFVVSNCPIVYENGAIVATGFVTNMCGDVRIWVEPSIRERVVEAQKQTLEMGKYRLPNEVVTSATLGKLAAGGSGLKVKASEAAYVHNLDWFKERGKGLYGGGYLLGRAAAERAERAAAERAERAAAADVTLSPSEKEIVARLK